MLFNKFTDFAIEKGYDLARKKGVKCPDCSENLELPYQIPPEGLDGRVDCGACQWSGSLRDLIDEEFEDEEEEVSNEVVKSAGCRVVESMEREGRCWIIPAENKINFFWVFAAFWLGITLLVTLGFIFGDPVDSQTGEPVSKWGALFLLPFWLIGLGVLYGALKMTFGETRVIIGRGKVLLKKRLFGREKVNELAQDQVKKIGLDLAYRKNKSPVYQLKIFAKKGRDLRFGSSLSKRDKQWLAQELGEALGIEDESQPKNLEFGKDSAKVSLEQLEEFSTKAVSLERLTGDGFKLEVAHKYPKFLVPVGFIALAIGCFVGYEGLGIFESSDGELSAFDVINKIMDVIPLIIAFVFCTIGLGCVGIGLKFWGVRDHYEFSNDQMIWLRKKGTNRLKNERYQRNSFTSIRRKNSGHVNNDPRYKLTLRGKKNVTLCSYVEKRVAKLVEAWVLYWLQNDEDNA